MTIRSSMRLAVLAASLPTIFLLSRARGNLAEPAFAETKRENAAGALQIYLPLVARDYDPLLIFFDAFSDKGSGWFIENSPQIRWDYEDGEYEILLREAWWWAGSLAPTAAQYNYSVEADIRRQAGTESDYGLIFDFVDWDHYQLFVMDPSSHWYMVVKINGLEVEVIVPLQNSPLIKLGSEPNRLKVERRGKQVLSQLSFYVNDQQLATVNSCTYLGGLMGVYTESDADAPASTRIDNFELRRLDADLATVDGLIAFESDREGWVSGFRNWEIYSMNSDGTGQLNLTNHDKIEQGAAWSPDGKKIAFSSNRDGNYEIYIMNADGTGATRLTNNSNTDLRPTWSPDGSKIAFASFDSNYDIWSMNPDGSDLTQLTDSLAEDNFPAWSPDGSKIAFRSYRDLNNEIYVMNADGTNQTNLTQHPDSDGEPDWSPDGSRIVFTRVIGTSGGGDIWIMNADGSGQTFLAGSPNGEGHPSWSPDGSKIAFMSSRDFNSEIYVMDADGSCPIRLTNNAAPGNTFPQDWFPDWQPSGVFTPSNLFQIEQPQSKFPFGGGSGLSEREGQ